MIQLIRRNPMLAAGILLPFIVVVFFMLATAIPRWLVDPPQYDFVFTSMQNPTSGPPIDLAIVVEDQRVKARVYKKENAYRTMRKLFVFDHETRSIREIPIKLPTDVDNLENGAYIDIPELAARTASTSRTSPDGYEVRGPGYRGGDFFPFFGGRHSYSFTLHKDGAVVDIPRVNDDTTYYYYNASFLGWLTD